MISCLVSMRVRRVSTSDCSPSCALSNSRTSAFNSAISRACSWTLISLYPKCAASKANATIAGTSHCNVTAFIRQITPAAHCSTYPSYIVPYLLVGIRKTPIQLAPSRFYPQGVRAFRSDQGVELAHLSAHVAAEPRAAPTNQSDVAEDVGHGAHCSTEGRGKHCQPLPGVTRNNVVGSRALSWVNNSHRACPPLHYCHNLQIRTATARSWAPATGCHRNRAGSHATMLQCAPYSCPCRLTPAALY